MGHAPVPPHILPSLLVAPSHSSQQLSSRLTSLQNARQDEFRTGLRQEVWRSRRRRLQLLDLGLKIPAIQRPGMCIGNREEATLSPSSFVVRVSRRGGRFGGGRRTEDVQLSVPLCLADHCSLCLNHSGICADENNVAWRAGRIARGGDSVSRFQVALQRPERRKRSEPMPRGLLHRLGQDAILVALEVEDDCILPKLVGCGSHAHGLQLPHHHASIC
mmetsp:Transcript_20809/g.45105  ORF Transcript_20809/g.45105 Transcript_20809/m.45105 type:complete len:218 (+) Transcript_20809:543-1196(+)